MNHSSSSPQGTTCNKTPPSKYSEKTESESAKGDSPVKPSVATPKLEAKDYIHYAILAGCLLWASYEGWNMVGYARSLGVTNPECSQWNPNLGKLFFGTITGCIFLKFPLQILFHKIFEPTLPQEKFPKGTKLREMKAEMTAERIFRLSVYITTTVAGYWIMKDSEYLHTYLTGDNYEP